ncbi:MAG TPA: hypothetical protein DD640_01320, partial [Clostridiales bacterium]|nr:hypothetical protein [Clostridiales bacterium]
MHGGNGGRRELDPRLQREIQRQQHRKAQLLRKPPAARTGPGTDGTAGRRSDRRPGISRRRTGRRRPAFIALSLLLLVFASFLIYRLYQIQIVSYEQYAEEAAGQHYKKVADIPRRGSILDRNHVEIAGTTYVYRIGITPKDLYSITEDLSATDIAAGIADCLNLDSGAVAAEMLKTDKTYIQLKKDVPSDEARALEAFIDDNNVGGIRIDAEQCRYYTNGTLASQVIGYSNFDEGQLIGQLGIELEYNTLLTGEPGYTYVETDNYSLGKLPFSIPTSLQAKDGQNVILNLDINIQKIAQEELENAIKVYDITAGGSVIIMNPYTGAVLAMASYPYFSCSDPAACPEGQDAATWSTAVRENIEYLSSQIWRNRAISDTYEPGSTMKAITAAIALEENLTTESEPMFCGPLSLSGWTINCSHAGGHGAETMQLGFWRSCNPVFAQLSRRAGVSIFYEYIESFGFRKITSVDLPAEGTGILHENPSEIDMVTLSYGESSTVTPIQLAASYCVFANGGNLVKPCMVKGITDSEGNMIKEIQPETIRKVISESTAARVRELMKGVVLYGTGSAAYVEGYAVAGKTSTSTDDNGDHTLSFAAIAPADNPEIVVLVVLNKPEDKKLTSKGAAKTCGQIISRTLEYLGISREYSDNDISRLNRLITVPDVTGQTYGQARKTLSALGLRTEAGDLAMGDDTLVQYQYPSADMQLHNTGLVVLYPAAEPEEEEVAVPDFMGMNVNECLSAAAENGLNIRIVGDCLGVAVSQDPGPTYSEAAPSI